jgi:hypothetical protein
MAHRDPQLQLPLLQDELRQVWPLRERLAAVTWSYSRRSILEQCARRYYYEYYGSNRRTAQNEVAKTELRELKHLSTRHERAGSILHLAVAWYLREVRRGAEPGVDRLVRWGQQLFAAGRAFSRARRDGASRDGSARFPPVLLREYYYRDPCADALCDEAEERLRNALAAFATDSTFAAFRLAACEPDTLIEASVRLGDQMPCRVDGKVDLAFRRDHLATVVDWKLGDADRGGDDSLQLAVYALWAAGHFPCDSSDLRLCKAYLGSREVVDVRADAGVLAAARARITQDAERMVALHEYGEVGLADAFSPCLQPAVCNGCPYQRACPEGRQLAHA